MLKKIFISVIAVVAIACLTAAFDLYRSGFFSKMVIEEKEIGPFVLIYQENIGDYGNIEALYERFKSALKNNKKEMMQLITIFYDNPREIPKEKLRSDVGMILDPKNYDKEMQLQAKYKVRMMDKQRAVVIEFPFKSRFSMMANNLKAYRAMMKYFMDKNLKGREMMMIFDPANKKIAHIIPL